LNIPIPDGSDCGNGCKSPARLRLGAGVQILALLATPELSKSLRSQRVDDKRAAPVGLNAGSKATRWTAILGNATVPQPKLRTCAVVMSSPILLGQKLGPEIDAHDAVFRINLAPSGAAAPEFGGDVGMHTSVRWISEYWEICASEHPARDFGAKGETAEELGGSSPENCRGGQDRYPTELLLCDSQGTSPVAAVAALRNESKGMPRSEATLTDRALRAELGALARKSVGFGASGTGRRGNATSDSPSSGMLTTLYAAVLCDSVTLYGSWPSPTAPDGRPLAYHYYPPRNDTYDVSAHHPMGGENGVFNELASRLHCPDQWTP